MLLCRDTGRDSELLNKSRSERKFNSTVNEDSIIEQDVDNFTNEHAPKFLRVPIRIEENEITKTYNNIHISFYLNFRFIILKLL